MTDAVALIERAKVATGLDDFGGDSFREGLGVLLAAIDNEARLTEMGQGAIEAQIVDLLSNRLKVEHWYKEHPEIDDEEIVAPLIGLGLPRTGSTAMACLLAEDQNARTLRNWESISPTPPPELATEANDPRIAQAQAVMDRRDRLFPRMRQMLPSTATSPTECQNFMAYDFKSMLFQAFAYIPSYAEWLHHQADLRSTYEYVKRILKLLQWRRPPNNWRIKNPSHSMFIDKLFEVFPDAKFYITHRDVTKVIPSVSDLYFELSKAYSDHADKVAMGELNTETWEMAMRRMIAFRDAGREDIFFDVSFRPFMKDPFPVLEDLYAFAGESLTDETKARMQAWRDSTPRDKHGSHSYEAADFGVDEESLRQRFAFYTERFSDVFAA